MDHSAAENFCNSAIAGSVLLNSEYTRNCLSAVLHPDPLEKLPALPDLLAGFRGGTLGQKRIQREGMKGEGIKRGMYRR